MITPSPGMLRISPFLVMLFIQVLIELREIAHCGRSCKLFTGWWPP